MSNKIFLKPIDILSSAEFVAIQIQKDFPVDDNIKLIYGVPRGGVSALFAILRYLPDHILPTDVIEDADIIVDDIIDSGNTKNKCLSKNPNAKFYALIDKEKNPKDQSWYIFPWEENELASIEDAFIRLRQFYNIDIDENIFKYLIEELLLKLKS
jgi:hypothetical protein